MSKQCQSCGMTLEEMKTIVDEALAKQHWPRPLRWTAKKQLPKLERWQQV